MQLRIELRLRWLLDMGEVVEDGVCCRVAEFSAVIGASRARRRDVNKRVLRRRGVEAGRALLNELRYPQWHNHARRRNKCAVYIKLLSTALFMFADGE